MTVYFASNLFKLNDFASKEGKCSKEVCAKFLLEQSVYHHNISPLCQQNLLAKGFVLKYY